MTWDAKRIIRYILLFCLFVGIGAFISIIAGESIDWGSALFLGVILTLGWIGADIMGYRRIERQEAARRKELKQMSKAEKRAFKEAAQARERREKEAAAANAKQNENPKNANGNAPKTSAKKTKKN